MAKVATMKLSSLLELDGMPLNPDHVVRIKDRMFEKGVDETPSAVAEEAAAMAYEAKDRVAAARQMRDQAADLLEKARAEEAEAETLSNIKTGRKGP